MVGNLPPRSTISTQRTRVQGVPALKAKNGDWRHEAKSKADLLAEELNGKFVLPDGEINEYSLVESCPHGQSVLKDTTVSDANKTLADLDEQSGIVQAPICFLPKY